MFQIQKQSYMDKLYKPDRSKKGNVDEHIKDLINTINNHENYYTTSSCSGRVNLMTVAKSGIKKDHEWIYMTHDTPDENEAWNSLQKYAESNPDEDVWIRSQPTILHVCAKDIESAQIMMDIMIGIGYKRTGIRATKKRIIIESLGPEFVDAPVYINQKIIVTKEYFDELINQSKIKMNKVWARANLLQEKFKTEL